MAMQIILPTSFSKQHEQAFTAYLTDSRRLTSASWRLLFEAVDLLGQAVIVEENTTCTFRQVYNELIDEPFADEFINKLLTLKNITKQSPALTAVFARRISPILEQAGLLNREMPQSWLLLAYCVYWWQSFTRGYVFEVEIMHDLQSAGIEFQMHDIRQRLERYSPADLIVLGLMGDIKTSTYFLQWEPGGHLSNDFYITRLFEKSRERTLVVFQKPFAWEMIGKETAVSGTLENALTLLPKPVQLEQHGIILIVVDYEKWKQLVRQKQVDEGA